MIARLLLIASVACSALGTAASAAVVRFDQAALGTQYGAEFGHSPGDLVLVEDGVKMSVETFHYGDFSSLYAAEIGGRYGDLFPAEQQPPLDLNNISVRFDMTDLPYDVYTITLEYRELGGNDNFSVNDGTLFQLDALDELPASVAPGVTANVLNDMILLVGNVDAFQIGGQELAIDTIVAIPEPTTALLLLAGFASLGRTRRALRRTPV